MEAALDEMDVYRRDLRQELAAAESGWAEHVALPRRDEWATGRVATLKADRVTLLRNIAELKQETRSRRGLPVEVAYAERIEREVSAGILPPGTPRDAEGAQLRWESAHALELQVWLEARAREFDPDISINSRPADAPVWAVQGRGLDDPAMPAAWRSALVEMADTVSSTIRNAVPRWPWIRRSGQRHTWARSPSKTQSCGSAGKRSQAVSRRGGA